MRRKLGWTVLVAVWCVAVASGGCSSDPSDEETVVGLAETWVTGWSTDDPDLVASVFTEDGTLIDPLGITSTGRDAIGRYVESHDHLTDETCDYEVTTADDGTFGIPCFMNVNGEPRPGQLAMTLEGDLASQIQWIDTP